MCFTRAGVSFRLLVVELVKTIDCLRRRVAVGRGQDKIVGFVPTMGALHIGHESLIEAALQQTDYVVVSIFVNPTQFGPGEDFQDYPRPLDRDLVICERCGVDLVFAPTAEEMYGAGNQTWVNVEKLTDRLCGRSRPHHFRGVTTVCAKLFNIVGPNAAFFGQKDAQQAIVVRKMVEDLNLPVEIVICPTVREADGLAVSSRNCYLSAEQRKDAGKIYEALQECERLVKGGAGDVDVIIEQMRRGLEAIREVEIEYVEIVDAETLEPVESVRGKVLVAVAAKIGTTRLIDNIVLDTNRK